ncbi:hypothetical protein M5I08_07910 [Candidatus Mycobacterium methanotrophicum]|uniref:Transposase n=1 Tax=Candidatus Mycobacterium methanotrophicum TaxID=2943498 RepID=A0ABY4QQZ4_9MYCO|nr:hypothetical protein [Candidatus Mycobacterium methanotrophicum]UQX12204.1 hypothetical protein M5I08_07910 [Candidatus Mycobacterium methanotrophicum]
MFAYSAVCDVPEQTLLCVTAVLRTHRREIGARAGRRAGTARAQAKLVVAVVSRRRGDPHTGRRGHSGDLHLLSLSARGDRRHRRART